MNQYKPGDWLIICDVCGTKIKASESKRRWDGLIVCAKDHEFRHPQDFLRAKTDKISVPFSRSEPADQFVRDDGIFCNFINSSALTDEAMAGCSICGTVFNGNL